MSALRPTGSTRRWRALVAYVLEHKGRRCQMIRDSRVCGAYASTVQHIRRREHGGSDELANLIPACEACNYGERTGEPPPVRGPVGLTARQHALVDALDAHGLACTAGRRQAAALLARWNVPLRASGADLEQACAYRAARGPLTRM